MTAAELLLAHFAELSETPAAIPRFRRFVLDLAVRGRLVDQDERDEPAVALLERAAEAKRRLLQAGEIKGQTRLPAVDADEIPFQLPAGWSVSRLGDLAACLDFRRQPVNADERDRRTMGKQVDDLYPYYGATRQQGWIDDYLFDDELLLLGEDGVPFFDPLRPKTYVVSGKSWVNNHAHVFRMFEGSTYFTSHWLDVFDYREVVPRATRTKLNQSKALGIPVPVPPLAEQYRIVAKVAELMALCERLEAAQEKRDGDRAHLVSSSLYHLAPSPTDLPANQPEQLEASGELVLSNIAQLVQQADDLQHVRSTVLRLAAVGRLSARRAEDGTAAESFPDLVGRAWPSTDHPFPKTWLCVPLGAVGDWMGGGTPDKSKAEYWEGEIPWVRPKDMKTLRIHDSLDRITPSAVAGSSARLIPAHSLLMVVRGMILARTFPVALTEREVTVNQDMKALVPHDTRLSEYLLLVLRAAEPQVLGAVTHATHGTCKLGSPILENLPVGIPPLAELNRILKAVAEVGGLCDELEERFHANVTHRGDLLDALLDSALQT